MSPRDWTLQRAAHRYRASGTISGEHCYKHIIKKLTENLSKG